MPETVSWDVVATVKAVPAHIDRFWRHYLHMGAARVFLFLDDPACAYGACDPRVSCILPDIGRDRNNARPAAIEDRQVANATLAARISQSGWILHCDIDEYLDCDQPVGEILAQAPQTVGALIVAPAEPLYVGFPESFEDILSARYFKAKVQDTTGALEFWQRPYGDLAQLSNMGFWAHRRGKSFYRTRLAQDGRRIPLHGFSHERARRVGQKEARGLRLRHFDALCFDSWLAKNRSRVEGTVIARMAGDKRNALSRIISDTYLREGVGGAKALFTRMFGIDDPLLQEGLDRGFIVERPPLPQVL